MKTKKPKLDYYSDILSVLKELKTTYPSYNIGRHLATVTEEYGDLWGTSDKELLYAFQKYKAQMEMDVPRETDEKELQRIIDDGMKLNWQDEEYD